MVLHDVRGSVGLGLTSRRLKLDDLGGLHSRRITMVICYDGQQCKPPSPTWDGLFDSLDMTTDNLSTITGGET